MKVSIVILTLNQFSHTIRCLESIRKHTPEPYEIIIVDNGSTDLTLPYLRLQSDVTLIENQENAGFAKGCNQGAARASGDHILYLNNDTIVTPNWLTNMLKVLHSSEDIGMVGPLTNYSSGHQQIPVTYTDLWDLNAFAKEHEARHAGTVTEVRRLVGFCMLMKRSVVEEVGGFDERYGLGNYEDDDLCLRTANAGYRMLIANDAFIHHVGHVTTNQLEQASLLQLLYTNREQARRKWGADIFDLIYKAESTITICIRLTNRAEPLDACLTSVVEVADEIIVCNCTGDRSEDIGVNTNVPIRWLHTTEVADDVGDCILRQVSEYATKDFIFLLDATEYLPSAERRQLRALKRSLEPEVSAVWMR
ncbi:glycosyltransferase family 2 protein [Paenibacillus alvei]|uniref:Glycosyltransferase family 2 protein n=2 Tax=Paenibacillus TaxID=44249 RepID=A0ABT4GSK0_PAEAL|nr:glycosyltransferase family 2 protein [Paenibacillus alvei]MCY9759649.1 glycosyltransferase family 2 protein [Paenibacillus alvei]MCY9767860.1 glycosyltransferase family 2 protein [Paenibacillus alvei]